jgi:SulP family sulfate permease
MTGHAPPAAMRLRRLFPGIWQLRHYERRWLRGDLLAGCTVAAYLVPQVMAYAQVAGLPAIVGLWAIVGPLVAYAIFGSSRQLSCGPESSTALMTASVVGLLVAGHLDRYANVAAALAVAVGAVCLVGWLARLGFLANLLSRPILTGYLAGIAVLMIISQLGKFTGLTLAGSSPLGNVVSLVGQLGAVHPPTLILAAVVLALLVALNHWFPRLPGPLIAMVLAALAVVVFDLRRTGIAVVGPIPAALPRPALPDFAGLDPVTLIPAALGIAVVGYSDNVLTARAFAGKLNHPIDTEQEFLALGVSNVAAGLLHGFPVSSSGSRTALGDAMGSRTQLHSLVALATAVLAMAFLRPVLSAFPLPALGGVVIYAATRLVSISELRRMARFRVSELALALATTLGVLVVGVLYGIGLAIALSVLDLLRRIARPHDGVLGYIPGVAGMHDVDDYPVAHQVPGLLIYRYDSPLFFANAANFQRRALAAIDQEPEPVLWFLLNTEAISEIDLTGVDALQELRTTLAGRGVTLGLVRLKHELRQSLEAAGFIDKVGEDHIFMTLPTAVAAYEKWSHATEEPAATDGEVPTSGPGAP